MELEERFSLKLLTKEEDGQLSFIPPLESDLEVADLLNKIKLVCNKCRREIDFTIIIGGTDTYSCRSCGYNFSFEE